MIRSALKPSDYSAYYQIYLDQLPIDLDLNTGYQDGLKIMTQFLNAIAASKTNYSYQAGKWTVNQVVQHSIDTERIFMYRCFRIARGDNTPIAGFEQDDYIEPSRANRKSMEQLLAEYTSTRAYSVSILNSLTPTDLAQVGTASGAAVSAAAAAFIILGHELWHKKVLEERYL